MTPYQAYHRHRDSGMTRIDAILALVDGVLERLEKWQAAERRHDTMTAQTLRARCVEIVGGLAASVDARSGDMAFTLLRLYDFVLHSFARGEAADLAGAKGVLTTLREAFQAIRPEALEMERAGLIPPLERTWAIQASA